MCKCTWTKVVLIGSLFAMGANATLQTPSLSLSTASGAPGSTFTLNVSLATGNSTLPVSTQWDLTYSTSDLNLVTGTFYATGVAASGAGKSVNCNIISAGDVRCIVSGINTTAMGNGVLATLTFQIADTTDTSTLVSMISSEASDANANPLSITDGNATVTINQLAAPVLSALSCSPASVTPPTSSTCTVTLSSSATSTTTVDLSSGASAATVPGSVNIASGSLSKNFTVTTSAVTTTTAALITATLDTNAKHFSLTLTAPTCAYSLSTSSSNLGSSAGSSSFNVISSAGCSWSVTNNSSFITVTGGGTGSGNGTVSYSIPANTGAARSGTLTIGGQTFTVNQAAGISNVPTVVSVTPSSGTVASQTFALQYSDPGGAASLQTVWAYFNTTLANPASNSCLLYYNVAANVINLAQDAGTTWLTATPGAATTLQNSQCSLNVGSATVGRTGNTLTLNLSLTFQPGYAGAKNIYMYAVDVSGSSSGWQQLGSWTVPAGSGVAVVSVTPSSGSAASQTFALQYSDPLGAASLQTAWAYFNTTLANPASNSCLLYYNVAANAINLAQDSGTAWLTATPGSATTLQNSQCTLNAAATTVVRNGNTLTVNLSMTFQPGYAGAKNIYMYAVDVSGSSSGWQQLGSWTVPAGSGVAVVSVTPSSGSAASQTFALQYSDALGAASLQTAWAYFNTTLANPASNSCLLYYNVAANAINLAQDSGTAWLTATPGSAITLQNSQCSLNAAATTVIRNGNTLTVNLSMTFQPGYAGAKNIYMYAVDVSGSNSGWHQMGSWTVPAGSGVAAVSVTPSSGSVASQTFALRYSDAAGAASLQTVWAYFSGGLVNPASNSCLLYYNAAANLINLAQDSGTAWLTANPGSATTLQNSQCSLNIGASSVTLNGNTLTLNLSMAFQPAYAGAKNIYLYAADVSGSNSGWQQLGTWIVP